MKTLKTILTIILSLLIVASADGGENWSKLPTLRELLAIDPVTPATLYSFKDIGIVSCPLVKSMDGGSTWSEICNGLPSPAAIGFSLVVFRAFAVDLVTPSNIYVSVEFNTETGQTTNVDLFASGDGGATWNVIPDDGSLPRIREVAVDSFSPNTFYALLPHDRPEPLPEIIKSTDGGRGWRSITHGLPSHFVNALATDRVNEGTIYVGMDAGASDGFVAKINPSAHGPASLVYSTYLGGGSALM